MANIERTVDIIFGGKDELSKKITGINKSLGGFESAVTSIAGPLAKVGNIILGVEAAAIGMAVAFGTQAIIKSKEFERTQIDLAKILGEEEHLLGAVTDQVEEMALKYGVGVNEVLRSTIEFKKAGFDVMEAANLTANSMNLVRAGNVEAAMATEILIATLKGFKAPASETARLVDILNIVSDTYATNVEQLGIGMSKLSPIAKLMGFTFEETAGVLTPVIEVFRSGDEAATALKMGLLKLIDDAAPVAEALEGIGVSQKNANGSLRSGKDILFDVAKAFETADKDSKLFLTSQLVGIRQAAKMVEVFDNMDYAMEVTQTALNGTGSAVEQVARILASTETSIDRVGVAFDLLSIGIGTKLSPSVAGVAGEFSGLLGAISKGVKSGAFDPLFNAFEDFSTGIKNLLKGIAEALPEALEGLDFSKLLDAFRELAGVSTKVFEGLDLTKAGDLEKVIQGVIDTIASFTMTTAGIAEVFQEVFRQVKEWIANFNEMDSASQKTFGNILGAAQLIMAAGVKMSIAIGVIAASGAEIENVFNVVVGSMKFLWNSAQTTFDLAALYITTVIKSLLQTANALILGQSETIKNALTEVDYFQRGIKESLVKNANETRDALGQMTDGFTGTGKAAQTAGERTEEFAETIEGIPEKKGISINAEWDELQAQIVEEEAEKTAQNIQEKIDTTILSVKEVEITPVISLEQFEAETARMSEILTFKATIKTAELEADTERIKASFVSLGVTITGTGDLLGELFGKLSTVDIDMATRWSIERQISEENRRREDALALQRQLTEAQIKMMEARITALDRGDGIITVDGAGLQPHLEAFMWEILSAIQVRVNEEYSEFLLGI